MVSNPYVKHYCCDKSWGLAKAAAWKSGPCQSRSLHCNYRSISSSPDHNIQKRASTYSRHAARPVIVLCCDAWALLAGIFLWELNWVHPILRGNKLIFNFLTKNILMRLLRHLRRRVELVWVLLSLGFRLKKNCLSL